MTGKPGEKPPINPPIPEQTERDFSAEKIHRARCEELTTNNNNAAALGCYASEIANRKKLAGVVHLDTADSHERLGTLLHLMKRLKVSKDRLQEALGALPPGHEGIRARLYGKIAEVYRDMAEVPEAMVNYMQASQAMKDGDLLLTKESATLHLHYGAFAYKTRRGGGRVGPTEESSKKMMRQARMLFLSIGATGEATAAAATEQEALEGEAPEVEQKKEL